MIKLIASDLDGTLLDKDGRLPEGAIDVITSIAENGVLFIPASGRQYESLARMFAPLKDKTVFLCENGALVKYLGRTLYQNPLPNESVKHILDAVKDVPYIHVIYCGEQTAFMDSDYEPFLSHTKIAYPCHKTVDSLYDVIGAEPCCKLALYSTESSRTQAYPLILPRLDEHTTVTLSGGHWCDVMAKNANKGNAMREIQRLFGIRKEECIAFGDHLNDRELLAACGRTFAPASAQPEIKAVAGEIIPSNDEGGVIVTLKALLEKGALA